MPFHFADSFITRRAAAKIVRLLRPRRFCLPYRRLPHRGAPIPSLVIGLAAEPCSAGTSPPTDHLGAMAPFQSNQSIVLHDDDEVFNQRKVTSLTRISPISEDGQKRLSRAMRVLRLTKAQAAQHIDPVQKQTQKQKQKVSSERHQASAEVESALAKGNRKDGMRPSLLLVHTVWVYQ